VLNEGPVVLAREEQRKDEKISAEISSDFVHTEYILSDGLVGSDV
jgi:hypothetical protein